MEGAVVTGGAPGPLTGKTFVLTGTLEIALTRRRIRRDSGAGRKSHRFGQQEDQLRRGGRRPRQQTREGRNTGHPDPRRSRLSRSSSAYNESSKLSAVGVQLPALSFQLPAMSRPFALVTVALTAATAFMIGLIVAGSTAPASALSRPSSVVLPAPGMAPAAAAVTRQTAGFGEFRGCGGADQSRRWSTSKPRPAAGMPAVAGTPNLTRSVRRWPRCVRRTRRCARSRAAASSSSATA